ncbi:fatty acid desaturase [Pleionea sediminis]|uniref:fatty acid desaturase n=1 Tax=Pleionea sediminis TaxID=2569479 RepID=UPI0011870502|nr:fatty acid desaturase [Pleionea sediminis]
MNSEVQKTDTSRSKHSKPKLIWLNISVFSLTSAIAFIGVPLWGYFVGFDATHWIVTLLCIGYCGMSITAGYHRLWSHKAYETNRWIKLFYAIGGAFAVQNSALHWASDHRIHHRHVDDNDRDPYSAKRGFWYSHIGWMLREYQASRYTDYSNVKDLQRDPIVMWQHRNYLWLTLTVNFGLPIFIGFLHGDVIGMLLTAGFLRLVISHHTTFFINSLAHVWGKQPYSDRNTARDNGFLALLTYGEGYHNFHHHFQNDYRNGIRWWHFDPTKWLIKVLSWLKLAKNLKRSDETKIEMARAEMLLNQTRKKVMHFSLPNKDELLDSLKHEYEVYCAKLAEYYSVKREWVLAQKKQLSDNCDAQSVEIKHKYQQIKALVAQHKENWLNYNKQLKLALA